MTDEDRRFIYRTLKKKFDFDEEYPRQPSLVFRVRRHRSRRLRLLKLKPMLLEMSDFVSTKGNRRRVVVDTHWC